MRYEILGLTNPLLRLELGRGEEVHAEPGATVYMRGPIVVGTGVGPGGILGGILRRALGGESFLRNTYRAEGPAELWLAPKTPGEIHYLPLEGEGYVAQASSYLAHHGEVEVGVAWRGVKGALADGRFFWLSFRGRGGVFLEAYGSLLEVEVPRGERVVVDNFHFVAMTEGARYHLRTLRGIAPTLFGGEGLVVEVEGPARLLLQSRHLPGLAELLRPFFPDRG